MQLINNQNLIGDLLGTVPIMQELANISGSDGLEVYQTLDEGKWVYDMLSGIKLVDKPSNDAMELDLSRAFEYAELRNIHMTQAWHEQFCLPTPKSPIIPNLDVPYINTTSYDYIFAPFGRSAPIEQKWSIKNWVLLGKELERIGYSVCVIGSRSDGHVDGLDGFYGNPIIEVCNLLKNAKYGCISIVTGISHLCYALGVKNYVLCNQNSNWGRNPDGVMIEQYIPRMDVYDVLEVVNYPPTPKAMG